MGLKLQGKVEKLYAYREATNTINSAINITLIGKAGRESVTIPSVPVLVALSQEDKEEENDIVLGINGIFDAFDITFRKSANKIILKKVALLN